MEFSDRVDHRRVAVLQCNDISDRWQSEKSVVLTADMAHALVTCRNRFTICSAVCFFPHAIDSSSHTSLSHLHWYKESQALHSGRCQSLTASRVNWLEVRVLRLGLSFRKTKSRGGQRSKGQRSWAHYEHNNGYHACLKAPKGAIHCACFLEVPLSCALSRQRSAFHLSPSGPVGAFLLQLAISR
jgi:hypothetical protein